MTEELKRVADRLRGAVKASQFAFDDEAMHRTRRDLEAAATYAYRTLEVEQAAPVVTEEMVGISKCSQTTQALIRMLMERDQRGLAKYGATLDRTDLTHAEWLQHMAEEMLDGAGYALAAIRTDSLAAALNPNTSA